MRGVLWLRRTEADAESWEGDGDRQVFYKQHTRQMDDNLQDSLKNVDDKAITALIVCMTCPTH